MHTVHVISIDDPHSFLKNYLASVEKHRPNPFLTWYGKNGQILRMTFGEFDQHVQNMRVAVRHLAKDHNTVVSIAGNTPEHLSFIVAALLEKKSICPMNPDDAPQRLLKKIDLLSNPPVWCSKTHFGALKPFYNDIHELKFHPNTVAVENSLLNNDHFPFIFIFTSGSTGHSKIVPQSEKSVLTNVHDLIQLHQLAPGKKLATCLPVFHVNALEFSFFCCLLSGAELVLFEEFHAHQIAEAIIQESIHILSIIPQILNGLAHSASFTQALLDSKSFLYFVTAAAPLSSELIKFLLENNWPRVVQGYGLSECVNFSCVMPTDLNHQDYTFWMSHQPRPPIGVPLPNSKVVVLDDQNNMLGPNTIGEIAISGPTRMVSYWNEPAMDTNDFFRTGDLGHYQTDASGRHFFFIDGRKKEIVKKNGFTVSLLEVDEGFAPLLSPYLDLISVDFSHSQSGEDIAIVMKRSSPETLSLADVQNFALEHIPELIRPRVFVEASTSLRTASGKPCRWKYRSQIEELARHRLLGKKGILLDQIISDL
ncbi:MAG: acyl--CoA ligase [Bdellovibrionaceae bacterium]|nr:acyl--CoA ligase [Pseudobdellovibrionaceae bacterium]